MSLLSAIVLSSVICNANAVCDDPAPAVDSIVFNTTYNRVTATVAGVVYDSGIYACPVVVAPQFDVDCVLYGPGDTFNIHATLKHWTTRQASGRGAIYVQHYQLLGGLLQ